MTKLFDTFDTVVELSVFFSFLFLLFLISSFSFGKDYVNRKRLVELNTVFQKIIKHCIGCDQIQTFLKHHGSAGVQHVAFHTSSILEDAHSWKTNGVTFIKPPSAYYDEIGATLKKVKEKHSVEDICNIGILIDAEKICDSNEDEGYLYQVFTEPVFESCTFFFELIQRDNARGFGAGNVSALWRALDAYLLNSSYEVKDG